jgi:hypothetical protein
MTPGMTRLLELQTANPDPASWGMWVAVGLGDPDEDEVITPPPEQTTLYRPLLCKAPDWVGYLDEEAYALGHVLLSTNVDSNDVIIPTQYLMLAVQFPSRMMVETQLPGAYMRELAVYIDGDCSLHTGTLLTIVNHARIWWDKSCQFRREFVLIIPPVLPS